MKCGQKRGWGVQRHPYSTPHPLSGTPYPRPENALRWLGKWPRNWRGGPDSDPVPGRSLPGAGGGDGLGLKGIPLSPWAAGLYPSPGAHPSVDILRGVLVGIPRSARYDNAYYQTMGPSLAGRLRGRHRPGQPGAFHQVTRRGAWSIRSGRATETEPRPGPERLQLGRQ